MGTNAKEKNKDKEKIVITLIIIYEQTPIEFKCDITEILEKRLILFANMNKIN